MDRSVSSRARCARRCFRRGTARAADVEQRIALVVTARSPVERILAFAQKTWVASSANVLGYKRRIHARVREPEDADVRASTCSRVATGPYVTSGLAKWGRAPPIPARIRAGLRFDAALDDSRQYARGPRHRLVPQLEYPSSFTRKRGGAIRSALRPLRGRGRALSMRGEAQRRDSRASTRARKRCTLSGYAAHRTIFRVSREADPRACTDALPELSSMLSDPW
jgi:hypothetical protein